MQNIERMDNFISPVELDIYLDEVPTQATGLVTSDNTQPDADGTITIGSHTYVFKSALTGAAEEVLIQTNADTTLGNLRTLINSGRAAAAAAGVLTSDETNPAVDDTVTIGGVEYYFAEALNEAPATATLTSDETQPAAGDTVTIGDYVYTFIESLTSINRYGQTEHAAPFNILIGADADETLGNLVAAVNGDAGEGTKYAFNTPAHPRVQAAAVSSHATIMSCREIGDLTYLGTEITKGETSSHLDWDGSGSIFTGGEQSVANEIVIGATADDTLQNLADAINNGGDGVGSSLATVAHPDVSSSNVAAHAITVTARETGIAGNSIDKAEGSDHLDWDGAGAVLTGGVDETEANDQATCGAVDTGAHTVLITAVPAGYSGNAVVFTESATHISISGSGTLGGTTPGSNTTGTSDAIGQGGRVQSITVTIPQLTGTPTLTIKVLDASGDLVYSVGTIAENATTRTAVDLVVSPTDKIQLLASAGVENDDPVKVHLR